MRDAGCGMLAGLGVIIPQPSEHELLSSGARQQLVLWMLAERGLLAARDVDSGQAREGHAYGWKQPKGRGSDSIELSTYPT